jgi:hypothetical protein
MPCPVSLHHHPFIRQFNLQMHSLDSQRMTTLFEELDSDVTNALAAIALTTINLINKGNARVIGIKGV